MMAFLSLDSQACSGSGCLVDQFVGAWDYITLLLSQFLIIIDDTCVSMRLPDTISCLLHQQFHGTLCCQLACLL